MGEELIKTKPKILIAEDDRESQKFLNLILRKKYDVDFCDSANEFSERISGKDYNIIIMDITLKGEKNGLSLIKELKLSQAHSNIPIVGLSAHVFSQDKKRAIEAGVDVYLTKPIVNKKLLDTIEKLVIRK
jgi:CheY-like chemotaxis protein